MLGGEEGNAGKSQDWESRSNLEEKVL